MNSVETLQETSLPPSSTNSLDLSRNLYPTLHGIDTNRFTLLYIKGTKRITRGTWFRHRQKLGCSLVSKLLYREDPHGVVNLYLIPLPTSPKDHLSLVDMDSCNGRRELFPILVTKSLKWSLEGFYV